MSDIVDAAAEQAFQEALAPFALQLGITDIAGIDSISDLWEQWVNNTRDVSVWTLLNMYTQATSMGLDGKWSKAFAEYGRTKFRLITEKLDEAALVFGDTFANDPELQKAVVSLGIVQDTILPAVETTIEIYEQVQKFLAVIEPAIPYIELIARAARIWILPTEGAAFSNDATKLAQKELFKITRLLYADIKKYLSTVLVPVPEVLMGLSDDLLDPSYSLDGLVEDELAEAEIGEVDLNWQDASGDLNLTNIGNFLLGDNPGSWASESLAALDRIYSLYGVATFSWFSNFYENLLEAEELLESHDLVRSPLSLADIQRYSKDVLNLLENLANQGYANSFMLKIVCDKGKKVW